MSDETEANESQGETPEGEGAAVEGGAVAVAVREEVSVPAIPAVAMGGGVEDPRVEQRRMRLWLPLLIPLGAVAVVALFTLNISRVFIVASEGDTTPAVLLAIGLTVAILVGATVVAALPEIRTSSLVIGGTIVVLVVLLAGSLVLGASLPEAEQAASFVEPTGPAINTLEVDALPDLRFQAKEFSVPGGINLIKYIDKGGTHTLVFDKNAVPGFLLAVPTGKSASKVDLTAETSYTIYCTIPGHREAGMEAEIKVGAAGGDPQPGTESPTVTTAPAGTTDTTAPSGSLDTSPAGQSSTGGS